jgi:hypothetical protein
MATVEVDWDTHYDEIRRLYLIEDKTLKDVMSTFEERHGITAT